MIKQKNTPGLLPPGFFSPNIANAIFLFMACAFFFYWYAQALPGHFYLDDYPNILENPSIRLQSFSLHDISTAAFSSDSGLLKRPLAMLSFGVNYKLTGFDPYWFKVTNIVIHLLNGVLIFLLSAAFLRTIERRYPGHYRYIPHLLMVLWLVHPINLTSILYVVQRMTTLSALFCLLSLYCYVQARNRMLQEKKYGVLLLWVTPVFIFLGLLCKENAALTALYLLLIEGLLFRFKTADHRYCRTTLLFQLCVVMLPLFLGLTYILLNFESFFIHSFAKRDFDVTQRLLTEARVVLYYLKLIVLPSANELSLFHDDYLPSRGLLTPYTTLLSVGFWLLAVMMLVVKRKRQPIIVLFCALFIASHSMESTFLSLELVHEHRNYLSSYFLLFAAIVIGHALMTRYQRWVLFALAIFACSFFLNSHWLVQQWSNREANLLVMTQAHPNSLRSNYALGKLYGTAALSGGSVSEDKKYMAQAFPPLKKAMALSKNNIVPHVTYLVLQSIAGEPLDASVYASAMRQLIETPTLHSNSIIALVSLLKCPTIGCRIAPEDSARLVETALAHKNLSNKQRALLNYSYGQFFAAAGAPDLAIEKIRLAVTTAKKPVRYQLLLVDYLIQLERAKQATDALREAANLLHKRRFYQLYDETFVKLTARIKQLATLQQSNSVIAPPQ